MRAFDNPTDFRIGSPNVHFQAAGGGVDQMKTTGLADGEVHHVTKLTGRTLYASTAGPPGCHSRPMLQRRFRIV